MAQFRWRCSKPRSRNTRRGLSSGGAIEHILAFVISHNSEAIRFLYAVVHHAIGGVYELLSALIRVCIACGGVKRTAFWNKHTGGVYVRVLFRKAVDNIGIRGTALGTGKKIFKGVVAAYEHRTRIICINIVVIVTGILCFGNYF